MDLRSLPYGMMQQVVKFLDWKDFLNLKLVSKDLSETLIHDQKFWPRECLRTFFSFDLEMLDFLYDDEVHKRRIKKSADSLPDTNWKKHLRTGNRIKYEMKHLLANSCAPEEAKNFVTYFFSVLRGINYSFTLAYES